MLNLAQFIRECLGARGFAPGEKDAAVIAALASAYFFARHSQLLIDSKHVADVVYLVNQGPNPATLYGDNLAQAAMIEAARGLAQGAFRPGRFRKVGAA